MNSANTSVVSEDEFMLELRRTFIDEVSGFLDECEEYFLLLSDTNRREEALSKIFRVYHSIKGSSSSVGCHDLAVFAHTAEDCLALFRKEPNKINDSSVTLLLKVNDAIRTRLLTLEEKTNFDPDWNIADLERNLQETIDEINGLANRPNIGDILIGSNFVTKDLIEAGAIYQEEIREKRLGEILSEQGSISDCQLNVALRSQKNRSSIATNINPSQMALKVDSARIDAVMDMVGELVVLKSQILQATSNYIQTDNRTRSLVTQLDKSVRELHERTLSMRMVSLRPTVLKLQRTVRDVAVKLGKSVKFSMYGEDTEIDRALVERIADPLMHLCRNAVDHGLESPEERLKTRKSQTGMIEFKAFQRGENVVIEISDDGKGIDKNAIIACAKAKDLLPRDADIQTISDRDAFNFMFYPGFSTAKKVTDVSGRGVGLDVVKSNLSQVKGSIEIESSLGRGSLFRMIFPLTTAITEGVVVTCGSRMFILPVDAIDCFVDYRSANKVKLDNNAELVKIKDEHFPLIHLGSYVGDEPSQPTIIILIHALETYVALAVDSVGGKTQVVLKRLGTKLNSINGLGGAAVMGDGLVALVIDVLGLVSKVREEMSKDLASTIAA